MLDLQNCKFVSVVPPISVAGGANATVVNVVDTKGFRAAALRVNAGLLGANGVTVIQWQESHESDGANAVNIGAQDNVIVCTFVNLLGNRRRYLKPLITIGTTDACLLSADATLYRAEETPNTVGERGLLEQKFV